MKKDVGKGIFLRSILLKITKTNPFFQSVFDVATIVPIVSLSYKCIPYVQEVVGANSSSEK